VQHHRNCSRSICII
jgi:hypothetical protein